jgi:DeoR/GlpR family transcriptional regulator of sugar metabolism
LRIRNRKKKVLQTLLASSGFVTSEQLAAETGVSFCTVPEDLKGLAGEP